MTPGAAAPCSAHPSSVPAHYETLRMAALGEAIPPQARSGLMLFLRRGMWAWARTLSVPSAPQEPAQASSPASRWPCEREAVVHLLAQMAVGTAGRRDP
jgi:hypothetical protein